MATPEAFPTKPPRKVRPLRYGVAHWIERESALWLVRRPAEGLLGGMAALPGPSWSDTPAAGPVIGSALAEVRHSFTHFQLQLAVVATGSPEGEGWWQPIETLSNAGLPTLYRRAVETVLDQRKQLAA